MFGFINIQRLALATCLILGFGSASAADLDPKAISIKLPDDIKWITNPSGSETAVLVGDPSKPGLYKIPTKLFFGFINYFCWFIL
ncbi:MAG: hypothetical protein WC504_04035 [Methylobacter sp.]|jgi:hypothetical protein